MARAEVGDDVLGDDPTVNRLQEQIAERLGKEAAIFVPSGTMSNQIAIRLHCSPGDEFLCEEHCHLFSLEQASYAQLSGVAARPVPGRHGVLEPSQLEPLIRPPDDHYPRTRMVTLENTHNRGAGRIQPFDVVQAICRWAHDHQLTTHLDGARLFNAAVATGIPPDDWAGPFDTVSVCFSKGLGAPVGSALAGPREWIHRARRHRKVLGGAMRQAGVLAAAAIYALDHHVERLADDHVHARILAGAVESTPGLKLVPAQIDSNMVIFEVEPQLGTAPQFVERLAGIGVLMLAISPTRIRAVTHLDVSAEDIERASQILQGETIRAPLHDHVQHVPGTA
jgi:threonine aldolase